MPETRLRSLLIKLTVLLIIGISLVSAGIVWLLYIGGQAHSSISGARFVYNVITEASS